VYHPESDIRDVMQAHGFCSFRAWLFYDRLNPIDRTFAEDLSDFPQVFLISTGWRAPHGAGALRMMKDPAISSMIDDVIATPRKSAHYSTSVFPMTVSAAPS